MFKIIPKTTFESLHCGVVTKIRQIENSALANISCYGNEAQGKATYSARVHKFRFTHVT